MLVKIEHEWIEAERFYSVLVTSWNDCIDREDEATTKVVGRRHTSSSTILQAVKHMEKP